jgi:signal transduction histidine kinase
MSTSGRVPRIGTWFWRLATDSVEASRSLWAVFGVESPEAAHVNRERLLALVPTADRERFAKLCRGEPSGEGRTAVVRVLGDDERERDIRIETRAIREGVLGVALDVSEWVEVESDQAHELRNQLMVVLGNLDLVQMSAAPGTKLASYVELALQSAARCAELTERMIDGALNLERRRC